MTMYWLGVLTIPLIVGAVVVAVAVLWLLGQVLGFLVGQYVGWGRSSLPSRKAGWAAMAVVAKQVAMVRLGRHIAVGLLIGDRSAQNDAVRDEHGRMYGVILEALNEIRREQRKAAL